MSQLRYFRLWLFLGYILVFLIIYLSLMHNPPQVMDFNFGDKVSHIIAYGSLMFWFGQLYLMSKHQCIVAILFFALGVVIEILQGLGGVRMFDYADMLANTVGVLLGWWLTRRHAKGFLLALEAKLVRT